MINFPLSIELASWVIQDKNYGDLRAGTEVSFAVELFCRADLTKLGQSCERRVTPVDERKYEIVGEVTFLADSWWVVDFGIPVFREARPPKELKVGDMVAGTIGLGIDPCFYFEYLTDRPGALPLIGRWHIDRIELLTAPFIRTGHVFRRDRSQIGWRDVLRTNAWNDDGGRAEYMLTCMKLDAPLSHKR